MTVFDFYKEFFGLTPEQYNVISDYAPELSFEEKMNEFGYLSVKKVLINLFINKVNKHFESSNLSYWDVPADFLGHDFSKCCPTKMLPFVIKSFLEIQSIYEQYFKE